MRRTYDSRLRTDRARANRELVVSTATEIFCTEGWVGTTMASVAASSGLTRQTVYQQFDGKLALLDACINAALSSGQHVPVRELPDYQEMGVGTFDERLRAGARWLRAAHERSARIQHVLDEAAVTDPEAAQLLRDRESRRWDEVRWALSLISETAPADHLVDSAWLLASRAAWLRLTTERGWSPAEWEEWFVVQVRTSFDGS